jgi:hypothetical protein
MGMFFEESGDLELAEANLGKIYGDIPNEVCQLRQACYCTFYRHVKF